jgi:hypothetical protein
LNRDDRQERLLTIKALGRIAYRHLKDADIFGIVTVNGGEKPWRKLDESGLSFGLLEPFRAFVLPTRAFAKSDRFDGRNIFDIRWDRAGSFNTIYFEPGEWERVLIHSPADPFN